VLVFRFPISDVCITPDLEVRVGGEHLQPPEAVDADECDGEEGIHVFIVFEGLMDAKELIPGSAKETFCMFRLGG